MKVESRVVHDDEWLTQVGTRRRSQTFKFHNAPRPWRNPPEEALSWVLGRLTPVNARRAAFGEGGGYKPGTDAVRYARAGDLRSQGFSVDHDPYVLSPWHVSVRWAGEGEWDDKVAQLLQSCCSAGEV